MLIMGQLKGTAVFRPKNKSIKIDVVLPTTILTNSDIRPFL
jgi:hypothetical protein